MKKLLVILLIIVAAFTVLPIAFNNAHQVDFTFLNQELTFQTVKLSLSYIVFGAFVVGVLFAIVFFAITGLGWKIKARGLEKQVEELLKQRKRDEIEAQFKAEKALEAETAKQA